jgi:hypothetical protein
MNRMSLKFLSNESSAELFESEFSCSLVGRILRCARGRKALAGSLEGTFQWTSAVQSMSAATIKCKLADLTGAGPHAAALSSDSTSWALPLDFALSKKPHWLLDMFGVDSSGMPIIKRLFIRMNPEKKRPGPARVSINPAFLAPQNIAIFLDGIELVTVSELSDLLSLIGLEEQPTVHGQKNTKGPHTPPHTKASPGLGQSDQSATIFSPSCLPVGARFPLLQQRIEQLLSLGPLPQPFTLDTWLPNVVEKLTRDIMECLRYMDIFSLEGQSHFIRRVNENTLYRKLTKKAFKPFHTVREQPDFLRLGVAPNPSELVRDLRSEPPMHVFHPTGPYAAPLIFDYLKYVKGYNIETHGHYYCGTHLVADVLEARVLPVPDALILGMDAAGFLLSSQTADEYVPFMLLPLSPHIIVAPKAHASRVESTGDYILQKDPYDCCKAYFRSATDASLITKRKVSTHYITPDLAFQLLREGTEKIRLPTGLEYFRLVEPFHECHVTRESRILIEGSEVVLLLHRRLLTKTRAMNIELAVRDAWLSMLEDPEVVSLLIQQQVLEPNFLRSVKRFSGLYEVAAFRPQMSVANSG